MNLKRCAKGHFYDVDKYKTCPHCEGGSGVDENMAKTEAYGGDATVGYAAPENQGAVLGSTVAYSGANMGVQLQGNSDLSRQTHVNDLGKYISDMKSFDSFSGAEEEDEGKTVRHSSLDVNIEPVVGWLVCLNGEDAGKSFVLKSGRNFIGRSAKMDVVLSGDMSISREKHAIILYEPKKRLFLAQPGESKELFYVNDEVVLNVTSLKAYDKLLIGSTELYFIPFCTEVFAWEDLEK